jgi:elongation factor P
MATAAQITAGMVLSLENELYRVESLQKTPATKQQKATIKTKLRSLANDRLLEHTFLGDDQIEQVSLQERHLEFLYLEKGQYCFLDVESLEQVQIEPAVIGNSGLYIKEAIQIRATFYGSSVFSIELPQYLELIVEDVVESLQELLTTMKVAVLETGAKVQVPPFIEIGDIVKIDTTSGEFVQRV